MKPANTYRILTLLFFIQLASVALLSRYPNIVEKYYSNGIYPFISKVFQLVLGWMPFSFGDLFYFSLGVFLLVSIYKFFKKGFTGVIERLFKLGAFVSVLYFLFHFLWGMNYHRNSLFITLDLERKEYTKKQLVELSKELIKKTSETHYQLTQNDTIKVTIEKSKKEILKDVSKGYDLTIQKMYPSLGYKQKSVKKSLFSLPLTYMGFSGYLNPFTIEAQVDYLVPKHNLPMIASHEVAHQLGYASESEANFIGYLAAAKHPELYYQYSANLMAMRYAVAATYGKDSIIGKQLIDSIPKGVIKNIKETQDFWRSYQNKAEPFFKLFYDNYLKVNQQQDGIKGYSKMVGLLVAYREKYGLD